MATLHNCVINNNTCKDTNTSNAGALFVYTSGTKVTLNRCTLSGNTSNGLGGGILVSGSSLLDLYDVTGTNNSASKGGLMYATTSGTVVTVNGLTVGGNTANVGGPIIWGNSANAKLYINKNNYTDNDVAAPYDDAYWATAIVNKLTVGHTDAQAPTYEEYEAPEWDTTGHPDVNSSRQLENALLSGFEEIRIHKSFEVDRTYYVTANTRIIAVNGATLTRADNFGGDIFVVGESADGTTCTEPVTLTIDGEQPLVIDGNKANMTTDVTGSAFFITGKGRVVLGANVSVNNCRKNGNSLALKSRHTLSSNPQNAGGSVAIIAQGGEMTILGGTYSDNAANADGGAIYSCGSLTIQDAEFSHHSAANGGVVYAFYGTVKLTNVALTNNGATTNGGAVALESNVIYESDKVTYDSNVADNGGALYVVTDAASTLLTDSVFRANVATKNGGAVYVGGFAIVEMVGNTATDNTAAKGAVLYADGDTVDATIEGMTVGGNTATAGKLVYGNSANATLWLSKTDYTDQDEPAPDAAYWTTVITGGITVRSHSDENPAIGYNVVDVSSAKQLENAILGRKKYIRIVADFEIDRTYYIASDITIFTDEAHTLTRADNFGGDFFVVGETANGLVAHHNNPVVKLTLGNPQSTKQNLLVLDGNMDNMTATVTGSVFFVCYGADVELYDNVTIQNFYKQQNEKSYDSAYQLSRPNRVGGAIAIISNGTVTIHGGNYKNNKVNLEDSSTEEGRNSSIGGTFYNEGNLYILGGTFEGNEGARGGIVYNYQTVRIAGGSFINNVGTKYGGIYYAPNSTVAQIAIGSAKENGNPVLFKGNTAKLGAGVICSSYFSAVLILGNTSFRHNKVTSGDGGVATTSGTFTAKNAEFIGNSASASGGVFDLTRSDNDEITRLIESLFMQVRNS